MSAGEAESSNFFCPAETDRYGAVPRIAGVGAPDATTQAQDLSERKILGQVGLWFHLPLVKSLTGALDLYGLVDPLWPLHSIVQMCDPLALRQGIHHDQ